MEYKGNLKKKWTPGDALDQLHEMPPFIVILWSSLLWIKTEITG